MNKQEYLFNSEYVTIAYDVPDSDDLVIVATDREELLVARRKDLQKKEDSWGWKRAQERANEYRMLTAKAEENLNKVTEKVIKKAIESLQTRMKLNLLFKDGINENGWVLPVVNELGKLIREEAPKVIKEDK